MCIAQFFPIGDSWQEKGWLIIDLNILRNNITIQPTVLNLSFYGSRWVFFIEVKGNTSPVINETSINSTIRGGYGDDLLVGGFGDDVIDGNEGVDLIIGRGGNDRINAGYGPDYIFRNGRWESDETIDTAN